MEYSHEHLAIQQTLRRFIAEEINPHVDEWEAAEIFPAHQVFKRLGALGLLGLTKPEEHGGAGLDYSYSVAMADLPGQGITMKDGLHWEAEAEKPIAAVTKLLVERFGAKPGRMALICLSLGGYFVARAARRC